MERTSDKRHRPKYSTEQPILSIPRYRDDAENIRAVDNWWKYYHSNETHVNNGRNERRQSNPAIDYNKNYYSRTDVPRTSRKHEISNSSRKKYVVPQIQEEFQDIENKNQSTLKLPRNQTFRQYANNAKYAKNIAVVRKSHYVDDFDGSPELENPTFNENVNAADETSEQEIVDEEHLEHLEKFNEKDYQEHEADDEIDEEPDILDQSLDKSRLYTKMKVESLPRNHKISSAPSASRYHRALRKHSNRCCHSAVDRKTAEIPTEEEEEEELEVCGRVPCTQKRSSWPSRPRDENAWVAGRKLSEHYSDLPKRSLLADNRQTRRPKSVRPGMEKPIKSGPQYESICITKCDRCGRTSRQTPRTTSSRNAACRLQESQYFIGKSNGDIFEEPTRDPFNCQTTLGRSKESRSPIYESNENGLTIDYDDDDNDNVQNDNGANSKSWGGKNSRETTNLRRASVRADNRHGDKTTLKTSKGYWAER